MNAKSVQHIWYQMTKGAVVPVNVRFQTANYAIRTAIAARFALQGTRQFVMAKNASVKVVTYHVVQNAILKIAANASNAARAIQLAWVDTFVDVQRVTLKTVLYVNQKLVVLSAPNVGWDIDLAKIEASAYVITVKSRTARSATLLIAVNAANVLKDMQ